MIVIISCYYPAMFCFLCAIIVKGAPKALIIQSLATLDPRRFSCFFVFTVVNFHHHADQIFVFLVFFVVALTVMPIHADSDSRGKVATRCILVAALLR